MEIQSIVHNVNGCMSSQGIEQNDYQFSLSSTSTHVVLMEVFLPNET
jgi:hypothetical protein